MEEQAPPTGGQQLQPPAPAPESNGSRNASVVQDSPPVKSVGDAWEVFLRESKKLWAITVPISFSMICLYGINSATQIFAGRLGNIQLSAVAIGLSVIFIFSFGFLVQAKWKLKFSSQSEESNTCNSKGKRSDGNHLKMEIELQPLSMC